jgi:hypothetical protein
MNCTRCQGCGFLNLDQISDRDIALLGAAEVWELAVLDWIESRNRQRGDSCYCNATPMPPCTYCEWSHDVQVCDCCGDGEDWYGMPGEHNYIKGGDEPVPECG